MSKPNETRSGSIVEAETRSGLIVEIETYQYPRAHSMRCPQCGASNHERTEGFALLDDGYRAATGLCSKACAIATAERWIECGVVVVGFYRPTAK